ncbi:MAG TPA: hypothetical protein VNA13_04715 [Xanthomonadales bacterium]|nr:hypothetical protein [Xanthomonadales bacterium]
MNNKIFFGKNDLRYFYFRYRDSSYYSMSVIILTISVCLVLIISVIIPLANNYFSVRNEVIAQREKIRIINENINFMRNINRDQLSAQLGLATRALPSEKDFGGILNALADSSIKSGVTVNDFKFVVGEIASKSAEVKNAAMSSSSSIDMVIILNGSTEGVSNFLKEINEKLPLAQVHEIVSTPEATTVNLKFYFKPYTEIAFKDDVLIRPLSPTKKDVLEKMAAWDTTQILDESNNFSSSSAVPLFE